MKISPRGATIPGITHHCVNVNGTTFHYVSAGSTGSPILLVHGFPESWWAFHKLIPLIAETHRGFAVDLRGFGDSDNTASVYDSTTSAADVHALIHALEAVVVATGARYRRLGLPNQERFEGAGIYYAATELESY